MSEFSIESEPLPGVYIIHIPVHGDTRGTLVKPFHMNNMQGLGLEFEAKEHFYSVSHRNVLRGMHFQGGAAAHSKIVLCSSGKALDVIVDVRKESSKYNKPFFIELRGSLPKLVYISKGYAHGFLSLESSTVMQYITSTVHSPEQDYGVLWSSINFEWPIRNPILSDRDLSHPKIDALTCEYF
jgi:dTDP-4-dehydrorhamnose 3,5-epimerase